MMIMMMMWSTLLTSRDVTRETLHDVTSKHLDVQRRQTQFIVVSSLAAVKNAANQLTG